MAIFLLTTGVVYVRSWSGTITGGTTQAADGTVGAPSFSFSSDSDSGFYYGGSGQLNLSSNGTLRYIWDGASFYIRNDVGAIKFGAADDLVILRDAANTFAQRNSTNAQLFRVYESWTDASNNDRLEMGYHAGYGGFVVRSAASGAGTIRNLSFDVPSGQRLQFATAGTYRWYITDAGFIAATDNTFDIGAAAATRPRTVYIGTSALIGASVTIGGNSVSVSAAGTAVGSTGALRVANTDALVARNAANNGDISIAKVNASDRLELAGANFVLTSGGVPFTVGGLNTDGKGLAIIAATNRVTAQTGAAASITTYTPTADASFEISGNILVTTATTHSFTMTCTYTDEGNTSRTLTLPFVLVAGSAITNTIANAAGAVPYMGIPIRIRAKASTAITLQTTGTFTTVTYNVEGLIKRMS